MNERIGLYRIESQLGAGPHGVVYKATDTIRRRSVAIKVLKPDTISDAEQLERLRRRLEPARELVHPAIAWIWEIDQEGETCFVASRFIEGRSVRAYYEENGALEWDAALDVIRQTIAVLEVIHSRGFVHGGIHASNVLINSDGSVVLSDMGLAQALRELSGETAQPAPTPAQDAYALALVLVELLSGKALRESSGEFSELVRQGAAPSLPESWPVVTPRRLNGVLRRALAKEPAQRYVGLKDFLAGLEAAAQHPKAWPSAEEIAKKKAEQQAEKEAHEQEKQAQEELVRQAAVEEVRQEIEAQIQRAQEARERELEEVKATLQVEESKPAPETPPVIAPKPARDERAARFPWLPRLVRNASLLVTVLAVVALLIYGIPRWLAGGSLQNATPAPTQAIVEYTHTPTLAPSATPVTPSPTVVTPSPAPTASATPSLTASPSATATASATFTATASETATATRYSSPTATWPTPKPSKTPRKSEKPSKTPTPRTP